MACTPITPCAPFLHYLGTGEHLKHHDSPHKRRYHTLGLGNNINIPFLVCTRLPCPITPPIHQSRALRQISDQQYSHPFLLVVASRSPCTLVSKLCLGSCTPAPLPCYRTVTPTTLSNPSPMRQPKLQGVSLTRIGYVLFCGTMNPIFLADGCIVQEMETCCTCSCSSAWICKWVFSAAGRGTCALAASPPHQP